MATLPRFVTGIEIVGQDEGPRSFADIDLTRGLANDIRQRTWTYGSRPEFRETVAERIVDRVRNRGLGQHDGILRDALAHLPGRLVLEADLRPVLPMIDADLDAFLTEIGGAGRLVEFADRVQGIEATERDIVRLGRLRETVETARVAGADEKFDMYAFDDVYHSAPGDFVPFVDDAYLRENPRPDFEAAEETAWNDAASLHVSRTARPFCHAVSSLAWSGVSADSIRDSHEEDPDDRIVENLLYNEMEEHHEDAIDFVNGVKELTAIVDAWAPHAGKGDDADLSLEAKVAEWNAKQDIVSYLEDESILVPIFPGVGKPEMLAWIDGAVAAKNARMAELHLWEPASAAASKPHDAVASAMDERGSMDPAKTM